MRVKKTHVTKGLHHARRATRRAGLATARVTVVVSKHAHKTAKRGYKKAHHHLAKRPHERLMARGGRYARWHSWRHHHKVHYATLAVYLMLVGALLVANYQRAFAVSDLTQSWDFATPANYTFDDDAVETSGTSARLKAQNYASDGQTAALYHMDESSGGVVNDSSSNANAGDQTNASFGSGQLNNALDFDGSSSQVSVPDSSSLSLSQQNTLEAWTKLDSGISAGSNARRQGIIDKGEYQLYYDNETGKITYELANNVATDWGRVAGNDINGSWDLDGNLTIESSQYVGSNLYIGLGNGTGDAEVWRWNGSSWTQIGGDGLNDCWPTNTYESVTGMSTDGTNLYVGLGSGTGDAEVWMWNGSTWTKIGGDGINSGWQVSTFEYVYSLTYMGGNLYAGLGSTANDAEVWRWNGSTWTKIGGDSLNSGWTTNFEAVYSLKNDGTNVYAGLGASAGDAEVWRWNGSSWTRIGGDAVNSSWANSTFEYVLSMEYMGGNLYAGLGTTAGDADLWRWNGSSWTQIGGDGLNSSWAAGTYEGVYSLTSDGVNVYAGLGVTAGDNEVWMWNGSTWTKIGGDGINSGFTNSHITINTMAYGDSTLFAGINSASATLSGQVWRWNGSSWTRIGGDYVNFSWGYRGLQSVEVLQVAGDFLYAGTGVSVAGNAMVWRYNGSSWILIGGQGVNGSWGFNTHETVTSMSSLNGNLYVGLGASANDAEVWMWDGASWTQIGGDSLNNGWGANYEEVNSMAGFGGNLYVGLGNSANDAEVWMWNGSTWSKIGGDNTNGGWATNYDRVPSMAVFENELYAGLGSTASEAEVWRWNGSSWTKVGGDGAASSWNTVYEHVDALTIYKDTLVAGLGTSTDDAEVWQYDGTTWTQIGGDDVNSSWTAGTYERARTLSVYNGKLYAGIGNTTGDGEVWEYNGSAWSKIAGNSINSGWSNVVEEVTAFSPYKGRLYAGLGNTANADASIYAYGNNGFLQSDTDTFNTDWRHIAATYNGTTMKLFIDGVEDASTDVSLSMPNGSSELLIGATYGGREYGKPRGNFNGQIDEVRISSTARTSFTTKPYVTTKQAVTLNDPAYDLGVHTIDTFVTDETANGGTLTYRVSNDDAATWQYWDGDSWEVSASVDDASTATEINTNIAALPVTFDGIRWQAIFDSDGDQRVTLNEVTIDATSDIVDPSSNADNIIAYKTNGGASVASNGWTNGASPYFTWDAATDADSGILGYCLYLGQDNTADPASTKGLLGNSPVATGDNCQFVVSSNSVDFATSGYIGTAMTSSNNPYYLHVKAIDRAGNVYDSVASFQFRFDNTPPSNPGYITAPSGFINTKEASLTWPTVGGQAAADVNSGVAGLQYRIGNTVWYGDTHTGSGDINDLLANDGNYMTVDPPDYDNIEEGINTIYFRTWDSAGNVTTSYVTAALKVNTNGAPSAPQNLEVSPSTNTTNSFAFSWDLPSSFVGDADNLTYCYTVNIVPSEGSCSYTSTRSLSSGAYATQPGENTLYVAARDESSNINYDNYATVTFTANTPSPGIPTSADIVDVSIKSTNNWRLALTWEPPAYTGAGISSYKIYRSTDNSSFSFVGSSTSTTYIDAGLSQQTYYYYARACDSTNNCGASSTTVYMLPTGKFTEPANLTSDPEVDDITTKRATISWTTDRASDSKVAIGTKSGDYSPSEVGSSDQVTSHEIELDNLAAGTTYYYVVKWTDEDGNTGISQEQSFTTDPAPVIKEVETTKIGLNSAIVSFTTKGATKISLFYGASEAFGGVETINTSLEESRYSIELTGLTDGSKYFYMLSAYDSEGNEYDGNIFSFTTPPRPRIENLRFEPVEGEPTSTQEITWTTNVPSTSTITYGIVGTNGTDVQDSKLKKNHKIIIRGLQDDSQYFIIAQSRDEDGNLAVSDRQEFHTALDTRPPKVYDITIEPSIRGTGAEARGQIIVSWKTDEPSSSQVGYAEGSNASVFNSRTTEDTQLATEHIVVVSDLPTSRVYSIQPISKDKSGNAGLGEPESAIIGRASESVLTIIFNTLQRVFGL